MCEFASIIMHLIENIECICHIIYLLMKLY